MPLDLVLSKKIGHPLDKEFAIGAVSLIGRVVSYFGRDVTSEYIEKETERIRKLLDTQYKQFTGKTEPMDLKGKIAIIVDDGIATGNTVRVCVDLIRNKGAKKVIIAVPVLPKDAVEKMKKISDELIYITAPANFRYVGQFYLDFSNVEPSQVQKIMQQQ